MKALIKNIFNSLGYSILKNNTVQKYKEKTNPYLAQKALIGNKENLCIFDVGAHYGETLIEYKSVFPNARIYSFEPFDESAEIFIKNTKSYSEIQLFRHAFSNKIGESEFYINSSDATNSLLNPTLTNSWVDDATKNKRISTVRTDTIDSFCAKNDIVRIDILKLDVQGGEVFVLEGAIQMLSTDKINMIFTEVEFITIYQDQPLFHDVNEFLTRYDYKLFGLYNTHFLENGQIAWCDAIYLKAN
jgi:FkbM family methyltransferase